MRVAIIFSLLALGAGFLLGTVYSTGSAYGRCISPADLDFNAYLVNYGDEHADPRS
jgi:hypothetical protein